MMTPEEQTRADVAVQTVQNAWEHMANIAITAETRARLLEARVRELEEKYEPKPVNVPAATD